MDNALPCILVTMVAATSPTIMMPKLDGYKALDAIRGIEGKYALIAQEKAKIIMISALDEGGFDEEMAGNQYDCYMSKPIDILEFEMNLKRMGMI